MIEVVKWDIHPDKIEAYEAWAADAVLRLTAVPGMVEFRAFRLIAGSSQVVTTYEFADLATWATWRADERIQQIIRERRALTLNETSELWGPSPIVPVPVHTEMYLP